MNPNASYRKAQMPRNLAGEAVPMKAMNFKETRAALDAYLKSKGDSGCWKRSPRTTRKDTK